MATTQQLPAPVWTKAEIEALAGEEVREVRVEMKFFELSYGADAEDVPAERYQKRMSERERQVYIARFAERGHVDMIDGATLLVREGGAAHSEQGQALLDSGNPQDRSELAGTGSRVKQHVRVTPLPDGKSAKVDVFAEVKRLMRGFRRGDSELEQPVIGTRRVDASFELSYGETVVLCGLITKDQRNVENKAFFLGDIPVIGRAFRWRSTQELPRELVAMITPSLLPATEVSRD